MSDQLTLREMRDLSVDELIKFGSLRLRIVAKRLNLIEGAPYSPYNVLSLQEQAALVHVALRSMKDELLVEMDRARIDVLTELLGKDHWNLLLYVETRCVDFGGRLEHVRMRCNPNTHPELAHAGSEYWNSDTHSTRWKDGQRLTPGHDDWDCLYELLDLGFIEIHKHTGYLVCALTDAGWIKVGALRRERAERSLSRAAITTTEG